MEELKWKVHKWDWNPTPTQLKEVGPKQFSVMELKRGMLIGWVAVRINETFPANPTIEVGTTDDSNGFVTVGDISAVLGHCGETPELYIGSGKYSCITEIGYRRVWNQTQIDALGAGRGRMELEYTGNDSVLTGSLSVIVVYCEIE